MGLRDRLGLKKSGAAASPGDSPTGRLKSVMESFQDAAKLWHAGDADAAIAAQRSAIAHAAGILGPAAEAVLAGRLLLAQWLAERADARLADGNSLVALKRDMARRGTGVIDLAGFEAGIVAAFAEPAAELDAVVTAAAAALGPDHQVTLAAQQLRQSIADRNIPDVAAAMTAEAVDRLMGQTRREVVKRLRAVSRDQARREADAVFQEHREAVQAAEAEAGPAAPQTLQAKYLLAWDIYHLGNYTDALELAGQVLAARLESLGPDHTDSIRSRYQIACVHGGLDDFARAIGELDAIAADFARVDGPQSLTALTARRLQADLVGFQGDYDKAARLAADVLKDAQESGLPQAVEEAEAAAALWLKLA
jgi:hypothetical protein